MHTLELAAVIRIEAQKLEGKPLPDLLERLEDYRLALFFTAQVSVHPV
jgi:hypothetical protein